MNQLKNDLDIQLATAEINKAIQECKKIGIPTDGISDGYHTFGELYDHRIALFIALASFADILDKEYYRGGQYEVWRSARHSDGTSWDGWFLLGINKDKGEQITYHLPMSKWEECNFAETLYMAPEFDGHASADVLERLKSL